MRHVLVDDTDSAAEERDLNRSLYIPAFYDFQRHYFRSRHDFLADPGCFVTKHLSDDDQFAGVLVGTCSIDGLMRLVSESFPLLTDKYRLTVHSESGVPVAAIASDRRVENRLARTAELSTTLPGVTLRIEPYETGLGGGERQ